MDYERKDVFPISEWYLRVEIPELFNKRWKRKNVLDDVHFVPFIGGFSGLMMAMESIAKKPSVLMFGWAFICFCLAMFCAHQMGRGSREGISDEALKAFIKEAKENGVGPTLIIYDDRPN